MIDELQNRIWDNPVFHEKMANLESAWLSAELQLGKAAIGSVHDDDLVRCMQAAAILCKSADPVRQRAAYRIAACAMDLRQQHFPGLPGALRIVLSGMGNFPAIATNEFVGGFTRLPTRTAITEETHRVANSVTAGDDTLVLTNFQRSLWGHLDKGENVAISAPTSAGKSFVLQSFLRTVARSGKLKIACYIVPSRALIAQVTDAITEWRQRDNLTDMSVINVPMTAETTLPEPAIYVLTQERLQAIMTAHPLFAPDIIICDEAQSVEDGSRGVLLQNAVEDLVLRKPSAQLIFAGPNIRNLSVFKEIFGIDVLAEVQSRTPTVVQNLIVVNTRSPIKGEITLQKFSPNERHLLGTINIGHPLPSVKERLVRISERFGKTKPSIIYANGPADAEGVAKDLSQLFEDIHPSEKLKELVAFVRTAVHPEYDLAPCLLRGVGFHYGRIPALVRRGVEAAFADGEIKYLVTTSTLIQGVNFPAANLFTCQPSKGKLKGKNIPLEAAEFWNLAGRAGRLGKEFQGNVFLIDYDEWVTQPANEGNEVEIQSSLRRTLTNSLDRVEQCALEQTPPKETDELVDIEAAFARLLADHMRGRLTATLDRCGVKAGDQTRLVSALTLARNRVTIPADVIAASPTMSALRQQRLEAYLRSEIKGGGIPRLEQLIPRHPRDQEAYRALSEIYRVCHEELLSLSVPKLHLRMAAISLNWMRGSPLPEIIDANRKYDKSAKMATCIRNTLKDIEQDIRFKYFRLASCYISVLTYVLNTTGNERYLESLSALPTYLEVGASDLTMISFIALGLSRHTARLLTNESVDKEMTPVQALQWLRRQDINQLVSSSIIRADIERALLTSVVAG